MGMPDRADVSALISAARRLRAVRRAGQEFVELHAAIQGGMVSELLNELLDPGRRRLEAALAEPHNHGRSLPDRGSVLDD